MLRLVTVCRPAKVFFFYSGHPDVCSAIIITNLLLITKLTKKFLLIINNGNFICVFDCTIVNLATYRQFTNAA